MFVKKIIQGIFIAMIPQLIGIQAALEIIIEDAFCPNFNKEYITEPDVYIDVNNRVFVNLSIIKQFPPETQVRFEVFGASMGEYVIQTGIDVQMGLCEMLNEPILLSPILRMLGFVETDCPPSLGIYGNQNFEIPMELLPDEFQPNKYLAVGELLYEEDKLVVLTIYSTVH